MPKRLREGALLLARAAQALDDDPHKQQMALVCLGAHAHERDVVHACCIGCGKSRGLKVCSRCHVATFCGAECAGRMWPVHQPWCNLWADAAHTN